MTIKLSCDELKAMHAELSNISDEWETLAKDITFYWDDSLNLQNGIMGKYYNRSKRIHLPMWARSAEIKAIIPTICHELTHYRQSRQQGAIKYALCNLTRINEIEARAEERFIEAVIGVDYGEEA